MAGTKIVGGLRRTFLTGLAALFPILITVFLLSWLYRQLDQTIGTKVNGVIRTVLVRQPSLFAAAYPDAPPEVVDDLEARRGYATVPGFVGTSIGLAGTLVVVLLIGLFLRGYVGSKLMHRVDGFFERFPVIKAIYPYARQVADFLFGSRNRSGFRRVVGFQYPRKGLYTLGFVTGDGLEGMQRKAGEDLVAVFVPTSPTPLTGFVVLVPRDEVFDLDMTVEEAFRFCMTAGMLAGEKQRPWEREAAALPGVPGPGRSLQGGQQEEHGAQEELADAAAPTRGSEG